MKLCLAGLLLVAGCATTNVACDAADCVSIDASQNDGDLIARSEPDSSSQWDAAKGKDSARRSPDAWVNDASQKKDSALPMDALRIYLHPKGDDGASGLNASESLQTLGRAHEVISRLAPVRDIEVRIAPGTYYDQRVRWRFTMPNHRIRFMPLGDDKVRPVFDGCTSSSATNCPGGSWFRLAHASGQETNIHFEYIQVQRYQTAISFDGAREQEATSNGSNRIYGCVFQNIGNSYNGALAPSTAAVRLVNSDDNDISNNHFVNVLNETKCGLIHALYVAHMSDRNLFRANRFYNSCGDPIRLRDFSNDNVIRDNRLTKVGVTAGYTEWYCDHDTRNDCTKVGPECPSWGNAFRDNLLDGDYSCSTLGAFHYFQDDSADGCKKPSGKSRLSSSGNTKSATPCSN